MVNEHLGKCADERDIEAIEIFARSPMFYLSVSVAVKDIKNILVAKLTLFGDNQNNIEEKIFSLILLEVLLTITKIF